MKFVPKNDNNKNNEVALTMTSPTALLWYHSCGLCYK